MVSMMHVYTVNASVCRFVEYIVDVLAWLLLDMMSVSISACLLVCDVHTCIMHYSYKRVVPVCPSCRHHLWWCTYLHCSYNESCTCVLPTVVSCGPSPDTPANGQRSGSGTTFRSAVTYSCDRGYTQEGSSRLTCMANKRWSGTAPTCNRKLLWKHMFHYKYIYGH